MTRLLCSFLVLGLLDCCLLPLAAQEAIQHTVDFPKGDAAWTVTLERVAAESATPTPHPQPQPSVAPIHEIKEIDVVRVGTLRRDLLKWADGAKTDCWWPATPPVALFTMEQNNSIIALKASRMGMRVVDATLFVWVNKATFKGMKPYRGKNCRSYEEFVLGDGGDPERIRAWIDDKTQLPVAWSDKTMLALFAFSDTVPTDPLILPDKYQHELARIAALAAPPVRLGR